MPAVMPVTGSAAACKETAEPVMMFVVWLVWDAVARPRCRTR
jgi:hypothetical protein